MDGQGQLANRLWLPCQVAVLNIPSSGLERTRGAYRIVNLAGMSQRALTGL